ncbi:MAG: Maf family protein [Sphingomonas sp.]|uniref:Maf family protein n=1 Tax=Sphingomonas sp. TaxID=28214 RepID=UPI0025D44AEF|nr:nucleoside triphosphate pyrophosphatase [Sphingomonas sp.]MBX9881468.1 Maf family protein [Sphingomonas sp.]
MKLVLASQSASRRAMLTAAGVPFEAIAAPVDESGVKAAMAGAAPRDVADTLAELKALKGSALRPEALVVGSDSIVALADARLLDKPESREQAATHLRMMSGTRVTLVSAAVVAQDGRAVWRHVAEARLHVRALSPDFIATYLDAEWPAIAGCVGCFRIEGRGVQLFERVEGDHFTILGMPLLPLLAYCRTRGVMPS